MFEQSQVNNFNYILNCHAQSLSQPTFVSTSSTPVSHPHIHTPATLEPTHPHCLSHTNQAQPRYQTKTRPRSHRSTHVSKTPRRPSSCVPAIHASAPAPELLRKWVSPTTHRPPRWRQRAADVCMSRDDAVVFNALVRLEGCLAMWSRACRVTNKLTRVFRLRRQLLATAGLDKAKPFRLRPS